MNIFAQIAARGRWLVRRLPDRVSADPAAVHGWCGDLQVWVARWDELRAVRVETTDRGPEEDNCFLVIENANGSFRIPSETPGFPNVVNAISGCLEGVDERALVESMGFGDNREFHIWAKPED